MHLSVRQPGSLPLHSAWASCLLLTIGCSGGSSPSPAFPQPVKPTPAIAVAVSGGSQVRIGSTVQFVAVVTNTSNTAVTWQVNGVDGGAATIGTISGSGSYTPPAVLPNPNIVTITAVSQALTSAIGALSETVLNPLPVIGSVAVMTTGSSSVLDVLGTGFVSGSSLQVMGVGVPTTFISGTELKATVTLPVGTTTVAVDVVNPDPGGSASATAQVQAYQATVATAARLLDQATFGPTLNDIQHVQNVGVSGYLTEQFNTPATLLPTIAIPAPTICVNTTTPCEESEWWQAVITGPDQLRQRVAFALSEIFVVSTDSVNARAVTTFQNTLANDAFTNYYTIMQDVSLSPAMGAYLNMLNSYKPGTVNGVVQIANENYPRELMQLFTLGINQLNADGTLQLDESSQPIPVYTEAQVQAFARAYTGWTYANVSGIGAPAKYPNVANYTMPMAALESAHDISAKILLNGTTLPSGQTAEADLAAALQNIFAHPNVGPFVCRQLIQHLVMSNPSPAYVGRVAAVFANNGSSVRGDMKAVITAILTDSEARAGDTNPIANASAGHLREAMLYMTNLIRGLNFTNNDALADNDVVANASYNSLGNYTGALGEKPYTSPSVFNFFPPEYVIPATSSNAPEFALENTASAVLRLSLANTVVYNKISGFNVDLSATSALGLTASKTGNAVTDSGALVDSLGLIFQHGQMSSAMRTAIVNHVAGLTDIGQRVRVATYLVITSSQYKIAN
ncbi:DUF1800 domain-containing protein [Granulicella arctica]|uniref:DUF1800 domain-containing protein n=1 Tax=Granulicella arctica TaxID=940613 RepID=UPI0021E08E2A|nr:DUF1800 domain-containing protein [Granulicella arctica]